MPIDIAPYPTSNPQERFRLAVAAAARRPEPLAEFDNTPSFKQTMVDSFTRDTITGSVLTDFVPYWSKITSGQVTSELDPAFDPYKEYANPEWLNAHPYMVDSFVNGDVFDIPNRQRFEWFMARQKEDYDIRQRIGSAGLARGILAAIPGQIVDSMVGGLALRGLGLAGKAAQAGEWLKSGSFAARTGKMAFLGSSLNLAQEEALRALNPSRHVDEGQAALWAVGLGAAFGSGAHMLASGKTKMGKWLDPVRARMVSQQIAADLSDPKFHGIDEQAAADADMLRGELSSPGLSVGASTPAGTRLREGEIKRFTVLRTPLTEQYIKDVEAFYGKDNVEWGEHPQQYAADMKTALESLDKSLAQYAPADLGPVRNAVVKTFGAVTPARKLYDPNLNPSAFSRLVSRVLFDFTVQTQEGFDNPLSGQTFVPAEGLRMVYNGWASEARIGLDDAFREARQARATHRMLDGRDVTIGRLSRKDFAEAVQEHIYATDEAVRGHRPAPEAHPSIMQAAATLTEYYRKIGMDGKASGYLKDMVDPSRPHFTQQWLTDKIERNAGDFKRRLIAEWEYNRNVDFATGQVMDPEVRTLKNDVVNPDEIRKGKNTGGLTDTDREAINRYAKENERPIEEVTEMDLRDEFGPELAQRYEQEVQIYFDKAADSTIDSLTKIVSTKHGVLDAMDEIPADVRKGRLLQINPTRFAEYLERDAFRLLESYDHMVSGRIASRMAIKRNAKIIDPFYKELMGHSIAADDYNPAKLIEAVNKHFQQYIKDERIPTDVRHRFQNARDVVLGEKAGVLTNKLAELERRASGSPVGWQLFLDRNLPRMPFLAQMGKVTMAAFNDLASLTFGRRVGNEQVGSLGTILRGFVGKPRRDIESLYVATIDQIRTLRGDEVSDYAPNLERGRFGGGLAGSAMSVADTSLGIAQNGLVAATGINKWSQAMRRSVAGQLLQDIIAGAKKMHAASNLVGQGFTQDKAFAKVGLAIEDARRLNRLGFNADRSKRLLEQIDAHGVDAFGGKVDSTHDGYISPEMGKWWKDDRDLFDTLNAAVNSETLNLIVEPKILSRPLMNNTLIGKLFNQFQGFAMAWGTQLAPLAMQRGGHEIAMYAGLMFGLGAIADSLRNELTGRRTLEDTVNKWKENPVGMAYGAIDRSGLTGWLSRPLGLLEHTPVGPGKLLKNQGLSSAYGRPGDFVDQFGPVAGWSSKVYKGVVGSMYEGGWNRKNQMLLWRATPFNNLWAIEGFNRAAERMGFDTPLGPRFQYQGGR